MNNQIDLLFALLRHALKKEELPDSVAAHLSEENAELLLPLAKSQDVGQIIADQLAEKLPAGSEVLAKFQKLQMLALFRHESLCREQAEICRVFEAAGIDHMLLKGAVIRPLYPEAYWRTSCDIDILVKEHDLDRAAALLVEKLSYQTDGKITFHDVSLHAPSGVHLELHFHIKEDIKGMDKVLGRVWEYAKPVEDTSHQYVQAPAFLLFHVIAHMARHISHGGCGIKPFADLFLIKRSLTYDEHQLQDLLATANLKRFYEVVNDLTSVWLEGGTHTDLTADMERYVLQGGLYGTVSRKLTVAQGKRGSKLRYILSRIFMPYRILKRRYPSLDGRRWLTPIYQVHRWCATLFGGKMKRIKKELQTTNSIEDTAARDAAQLLCDIGLQ